MSKISVVGIDELRKMRQTEGLVLQGCGGDPMEWLNGINGMFMKDEILLDDSKFEEALIFKHDGLTNLLFPFKEDVKINYGRLAIWRLASHEIFGGTWLTDYVENRLGGFVMSDFEREIRSLNHFRDVEATFEFQSETTGDLPVCLMWNRTEGKAWLAPGVSCDGNEQDYQKAMQSCEQFGIKPCQDVAEFNDILDSLGENAQNCKVYEDETVGMNLC